MPDAEGVREFSAFGEAVLFRFDVDGEADKVAVTDGVRDAGGERVGVPVVEGLRLGRGEADPDPDTEGQ